MTEGYGSTEAPPPLESIVEGQALQPPEPAAAAPAPATSGGHRRHRSRGGGGTGTGGHHSRSESLIESLADIVDVLQTIDEVQVDRPGEYHLSSSGRHNTTLMEAAAAGAAAAAAAGSASPTLSTTSSHRRGASRSARRGGHSRGGSIVESIMDEVLDIRDAIVEELDKADDGEKEFCFLEMSLARDMSILPEDLVRVAEVTAPDELLEMEDFDENNEATTTTTEGTDPEKQPLKGEDETVVTMATLRASHAIPLNAYLLLASAVVALSSVGPLLNVQSGINPVLKVYWRMSATAMCLFPFAAASVYREGGIREATKSLHGPQLVTLFVTAACYATMCVAFVLSLKYTAVGNAVILSNSQSVLLLIGKIFVGQRILALEAAGAIIAFAGATVCSLDSAAREAQEVSGSGTTATSSGDSHLTLLGDGLAMMSAVGGVFYLTFAKAVRPHFNLYVFMFLIMFCGSSIILIFMLIYRASTDYHVHHTVVTSLTHFHISIDRNIEHGIWGWMNWRYDRLPLELTMVILCNIFGAMGYIRAMQYFDNLIIAVATLLEPVIATLTAVFLGVGLLPGTLGWVGNAMVALGTFAVVYPSASSGKGGGGH